MKHAAPKLMTEKDRTVGEQIVRAVLDGGLEVAILPKPGYAKKYALLSTRYGSIDSDFVTSDSKKRLRVPAGVAHFLEHKMFEKSDGDVTDKFARLGCSTNAMTGFNSTGYLVECTQHFEEALRLLVSFVLTPHFTKELVDKEKGIIAEEIKMYQDDPSWCGYMNVLGGLFGKHPVTVDIAGTVESIQRITADHLLACHRTFYHPSNMLLVIVGDVDARETVRVANEALSVIGVDRSFGAERSPLPEPPARARRRRSVRMPVATPKQWFGWRITPESDSGVDAMNLEIAAEIWMTAMLGKSGPIHKGLYQAGLIDDSFSFSVEVEKEFAFVIASGDSAEPAKLEKALLDLIERHRRGAPSDEDIERVRRKLYGSFVRSFNSVESIAWNITECWVKDLSYLDYGAMIFDLPDDSVRRIGEMITKDACTTTVVAGG